MIRLYGTCYSIFIIAYLPASFVSFAGGGEGRFFGLSLFDKIRGSNCLRWNRFAAPVFHPAESSGIGTGEDITVNFRVTG
jgi:hypothetical protein